MTAAAAGSNPPAVPHFRADREYHLGNELGHGASGRVFECTCTDSDETFAVKVVDMRHLRLSGGTDRVLKNLRREVKILKSLPTHANIVRMVDSLEKDEFFYLVLELVSGGDLFSALMHRAGPRPRLLEKEAAFVFSQLLEGLAFLHGRGVVHRDLKLENILIASETRDGPYVLYRVKITDFGLSKAIGSGLIEAHHSVVGTRRYAAPEILTGGTYDFRVDLWSLGVVLYILLVGRYPHDKPTIVKQDFIEDVVARVDCGTTAKTILDGLLRLDPTRRYSLDRLKEFRWKGEESRGSRLQNLSDDTPASHLPSQLSYLQTKSLFGSGSQEWIPPPGAPGDTPEADSSGLSPADDAYRAPPTRQASILMPSASSILGLAEVVVSEEEDMDNEDGLQGRLASSASLLGDPTASSVVAGRERPPLPRRRKKKHDAGDAYEPPQPPDFRAARSECEDEQPLDSADDQEMAPVPRGEQQSTTSPDARPVVPTPPPPAALPPLPPRPPPAVPLEELAAAMEASVRESVAKQEARTSLNNVHVTDNEVLVHIVIPDRFAGSLLGKAGAKLRQVKAATGCNAWMTPRDGNSNRSLVLVGNSGNNVAAQRMFVEMLSQELAANGLALQDITVVLFLPAPKVGYVVGKSGSGLLHIHQASATKVNVLREEMDGKRLCTIVGTFDNVLIAERLIFEMIGQPLPAAASQRGQQEGLPPPAVAGVPAPQRGPAPVPQSAACAPATVTAAINSSAGSSGKKQAVISPITTVPLASIGPPNPRKRPRTTDGGGEAPYPGAPPVPPESHSGEARARTGDESSAPKKHHVQQIHGRHVASSSQAETSNRSSPAVAPKPHSKPLSRP
mmetsp:Transcript_7381/g.13115  ORF Transcript_7381/g.13115 Transcript_7381/m.13115 type:complete len:849 (-) Transcript_7381:86-2632(-)